MMPLGRRSWTSLADSRTTKGILLRLVRLTWPNMAPADSGIGAVCALGIFSATGPEGD